MVLEELASGSVRVDGSGQTDLITLRGKSEIYYRGGSKIIFDATLIEAKGDFEVSAKQGGKKRAFMSGQIRAGPDLMRKDYRYVKPVLSEPSLEVIVSGHQERKLVINSSADYYLIPVGVMKRVLQETVDLISNIQPDDVALPRKPFTGFKGHLKMLADKEYMRRSNISLISAFVTMGAFYREVIARDSEGKFDRQIEELSRHIFPYWDSNRSFVLLDSIGPIIDFRTLKEATLQLDGNISMKLPYGFIINGVEYESGRIRGKGTVTLQGGIDKLSLTSTLRVESDFARVTGQLDLIRSDGIAKNWPTSVQLSPAILQMSAKANAKPNPKYWASLAGLGSAGLMVASYPLTLGIEVLTEFNSSGHIGLNQASAYVMMLSLSAMMAGLLVAAASNTSRVNQEKTIIQEAHIQSGYTGKLFTGNIVDRMVS